MIAGGQVICKDKKTIDKLKAKEKIEKHLNSNYYLQHREWPYKNVKPRIIVEQYMENVETGDLPDYKFFCFGNKCRLMFIATDRQSKEETCFDFFDEKFNHLSIKNGHNNAKNMPQKPKNFEKMVEMAEKLAKEIKSPHVRIDFYEINGNIYFGEITFFHWSGLVPFEPEEWDKKLGDYIDLGI